MSGLYGLDAHGDAARYHLYRRTYFEHAAPPVARLFDRLLARLVERPGEPATRLVELSELQSALGSTEDRRALGELVFPRSESLQDAEVRRAPGAGRALVLSRVRDDRGLPFAVREPIGPSEVGRLLRLLSEAGLAAGTLSRHLVLLDTEERVVGGIAWRHDAPRVAHLEGIVVAPGLRSHGLALALVEDFCARRTSAGDVAVHTHFGPGPFPFAPGFGVDRRWGGLVRLLEKDPGPAARSDGP
jgi:GNAT superfamily N-acetyltransferase